MKSSTVHFLVLHLMATTLMIGSLAAAGDGLRMVWYGVSALAIWPTLGTLQNFMRYYRVDLEQR